MFKKVLVANRGEIAVRVFRALRELEIPSVAVYADQDADSLHVHYADYSYPLYGTRARDTYMNIEKIIKLAREIGVDAIHPGYGFLSEKEEFAKAVEDAGITFIGPKSDVIALMGNKFEARAMAERLNVPLVPGENRSVDTFEDALSIADRIGFPVLVKPAAGGGGKGMKIAFSEAELEEAFSQSRRLAQSVFGDASVFVEKYFDDARHVEVQILGDKYGNVIHLGERECSIQRRFQKIVEESPCSILTDEIRQKFFDCAVSIGKDVKYSGAGTVEFIYSHGKFYFLEMNTRVQVEHAVSEMVSGVDIVKEMILIAAGRPLSYKQEDICFRGHAIECRIYAEDPLRGFIPTHETVTTYHTPEGIGVRIDSGIRVGASVSHHYDPMMAKLIVLGSDRKDAIMRMRRALDEFVVEGPATNMNYLKAIMENQTFLNSRANTKFIEYEHEGLIEMVKEMPVWKNKKLKDMEYLNNLAKEITMPNIPY